MDHTLDDREDGLAHCLVCGGAEGSLPTDCPGSRMTGDKQDDVYSGKLDFVLGQWVKPDSSAPADVKQAANGSHRDQKLNSMKEMKMSKAPATKTAEQVAAAVADTPATTGALAEAKTQALAMQAINFEEDAGVGTEGVDKDSQAIPFLTVLQSNSPAVVDELVEGAKAGLFMNTVTGELMKEVVVVPVSFQRRFLEWAPRSAGGGFKGEHKPIDIESGKLGEEYHDEKGIKRLGVQRELPGGNKQWNLLKDTRSHFVIALRPDGTFFPALVSMSSTQIKKSKKWISMMLGVQVRNAAGKLFNPATFSHAYRLSSVKEQNDQGQWFGILVDAAGPVVDPEVYNAAKELNKMISAGKVQVAQPDANVDGEETAGSSEAF